MKRAALLVAISAGLAACAAPLRTQTTSFPAPQSVAGHEQFDGLVIAAVPVADRAASIRMFGTDMANSGLLPVQIIAQNRSSHQFEVDAAQAFGVGTGGVLTPPLTLQEAAATVRASSIGTTAATEAAMGALAGAVAGAAIGAGAGNISGNAGGGAASGAAIGAAVGGAAGVASGTSDAITVRYEEELGAVTWGDRVLDGGDIQEGMIFLRRGHYSALRLKVFDVTANRYDIVQLALPDGRSS